MTIKQAKNKPKHPLRRKKGFAAKPGAKGLTRTKFKPGKGRIGKMRQDCNAYAKERYLELHTRPDGTAPGQCCGDPLPKKGFEAHHKVAVGEKLENKAAVHHRCHDGFIHDRQHPEHRRAMEHWAGNVVTGGVINWDAYGLGEAWRAFRAGLPQPKGIVIPVGIHKGKLCQGCREVESLGLKVWTPCILHQAECYDGLFAPGEK
jgi:hypothetical protein